MLQTLANQCNLNENEQFKVERVSPASLSSPKPQTNADDTNDKTFIFQLNRFIKTQLDKIDNADQQQRFKVYCNAFDLLVGHVFAYQNLLVSAKNEYERCFNVLKDSQSSTQSLENRVRELASLPTTLHNLDQRISQLKGRVAEVQSNNEKLSNELRRLIFQREEKARQMQMIEKAPPKVVNSDNRHIPGLTPEQNLDMKYLKAELGKLEAQVEDLVHTRNTRYIAKERKRVAREKLIEKQIEREEMERGIKRLKEKRSRLLIGVDAAKTYHDTAPPNVMFAENVMQALNRELPLLHAAANNSVTDSKDDALFGAAKSDSRATESLLDYIDRFNDLLAERNYEAAAIHAANSPKGVLRTYQTMERFKMMRAREGGRSPMLAFCDAIMSSSLGRGPGAAPPRVDENMSRECVECVLEEDRVDLLTHWMTQEKLTLTEDIGDTIYTYCRSRRQRNSLYLAENVYVTVGAHKKAVYCMAEQGKIANALAHSRLYAKMDKEDYLHLLAQNPSPQLARFLTRSTANDTAILTMGEMVWSLLQLDANGIGLAELNELYKSAKAKFTMDTPVKQAMVHDPNTTTQQWTEIAEAMKNYGYTECAAEILGTLPAVETAHMMARLSPLLSENTTTEQVKNENVSVKKKKKSAKKDSSD